MTTRPYETMLLMRPQLDEAARGVVIEKIRELGKRESVELTSVEEMGKKTLAYPILKLSEAYYYLITFDSETDFVKELDRNLKLSEDVIRFLTVQRNLKIAAARKPAARSAKKKEEPATDSALSTEEQETSKEAEATIEAKEVEAEAATKEKKEESGEE